MPAAPMIRPPSHLIHLGRPDAEEPKRSFHRCEGFHKENPDMNLLVVLWDEKDVAEVKEKLNSPKDIVYHWTDDESLMVYLMDNLPQMIGAQIVGPRWYKCTEGHLLSGTYLKQKDRCDECQNPVVLVEPFKEKAEKFYECFLKVIKLINFDTTSGVFLQSSVNPMANLLRNMPYAFGCEHQPATMAGDIRGAWAGKPALICGAGPSLEDAIPNILKIQDRVKIICVGRAFKMLQAAGIRVDYTVSVEMFDWDAAIFDGVTPEMAKDTTLCFASVCAHETVKKWPGKRLCLWDIETAMALGRKDHILGGNSVSHHMLNFAAQILEADPIIMVGIDLSYTKPYTHAKGTNHEWPEEIKKKEDEYQVEDWLPSTGKGDVFHPECHRVQAVVGGVISPQVYVRSSQAYANFGTLFGILIAKHRKRVFNACPNGLRIAGAPYHDLSNGLDFPAS